MAMMGSGTATGPDRAREAAEAAIRSPLLEDIDIRGARGILVNITGGMDMTIGEFDDVGNTVKEFASDDATVVVGTVIDPEMSDSVRVTVVATGLGTPSNSVRNPRLETVSVPETYKRASGDIDYERLEAPTVYRNNRQERSTIPDLPQDNEALLDIPAFLRKQAD